MGNEPTDDPTRSPIQKFLNSLVGMITIGVVVGLVLCSPFFFYWQRSSPEIKLVSSGPGDLKPQAIPAQTKSKTDREKQTASGDQFPPPPEPPTASHEGQPPMAHEQFEPTYCPRPGDTAVIGQPQGLSTGLIQMQIVFYPEACFESLESLTPFMKPHEFDGHLGRTPTIQMPQAKRYLVQAGTEAKIIDKAGICYDIVLGQERKIPIYKVEITGGLLQGRQLFCRGLALQQEAHARAEPWSMEDYHIHTLVMLEADNPEYVLAQYKSKYIFGSDKYISFLTARFQAHHMEPPKAERQAFQKQMSSDSAEPVADQSGTEATSKPDRSSQRDEDNLPAKKENQRPTIAILEQTGGHTKYGGMVPNYEVVVIVRNTSSQPLKLLTMTVLLRRADNSLIGTEARVADVRTLEPGDTSTIKMDTGANLDEIDHYDLRFTADFPDETNVDFTVEQPDRPPPRAKAPTGRHRL
jgi:hypothetical protein